MHADARHAIVPARSYPADAAVRVPPAATPADPLPAGARSYLDFRVSAEGAGAHAVAITYDHASPVPLDVGFAVDRVQVRTVRFPPLAPGACSRTVTVRADLPCGAAVIRVAEGPTDARLHLRSVRITRRRADGDPRAGRRGRAADRLVDSPHVTSPVTSPVITPAIARVSRRTPAPA